MKHFKTICLIQWCDRNGNLNHQFPDLHLQKTIFVARIFLWLSTWKGSNGWPSSGVRFVLTPDERANSSFCMRNRPRFKFHCFFNRFRWATRLRQVLHQELLGVESALDSRALSRLTTPFVRRGAAIYRLANIYWLVFFFN